MSRAAMASRWLSITVPTSELRRKDVSSTLLARDFQALYDSRFSMSCCRRSAFSRRIEATSRWLSSIGPTAPSSRRSVPSRMFASGVLSSCDMWRRKRFRSSAMSSRRVRSHSSWRPRAERSAGPLIAIACENAPRPRSLIARSMARSGRSTKNQKMPATASAAGTRPMMASSRPCCVALRLALDLLEARVDAEARPLGEPVRGDVQRLEAADDRSGPAARRVAAHEGGGGFARGPHRLDVGLGHVFGEFLQRAQLKAA